MCAILTYQAILPCKNCSNHFDTEIDYNSSINLLTYNTSYKFNEFDFLKLKDFIKNNDIDILVFQEISPEFKNNLKKLENYNVHNNLNENLNFWDTLIMSKLPIQSFNMNDISTRWYNLS